MKREYKMTKGKVVAGLFALCIGRVWVGDFFPLALPYFAVAHCRQLNSWLLLMAMGVGIYSKRGLQGLLVVGLSAALLTFVLEVLDKWEKRSEIRISIATGSLSFLVESYLLLQMHPQPIELLKGALKGIIIGALTYLLLYLFQSYKDFYGKKNRGEHVLMIALILSVFLFSFPTSLTNVFAFMELVSFFSILYMSCCYGLMEAVFLASFVGAVLSYQYQDMKMLGFFVLSAAGSGLLRSLGKIGVALGLGIASGALILCTGMQEYASVFAKGYLSGAIIFLFAPKGFFQMHKEVDAEPLFQEQMRQRFQEKMKEIGGAMTKMHHCLLVLPAERENLRSNLDYEKHILMQVKERVCEQCPNVQWCYGEEQTKLLSNVYNICQQLAENGGLTQEQLKSQWIAQCPNQREFLIELNREFERRQEWLSWNDKMFENRQLFAQQMKELSGSIVQSLEEFRHELIEDKEKESQFIFAMRMRQVYVKQVMEKESIQGMHQFYVMACCKDGVMMTTKEMGKQLGNIYQRNLAPSASTKAIVSHKYQVYEYEEMANFKVLKGIAKAAKENEKVSGDNYSMIDSRKGQFIAMLSDGMGTGTEASKKSEILIELLEEFLEAGFPEKSAMNLANSVLSLRLNENQFSTLDLALVDLYSGVCQFIKVGACTTFILRENWVETIQSTSLPAGVFDKLDYDTVSKKLYPEDLVVMLSDGVLDAIIVEEKENYVKEFLLKQTTKNPQQIARLLLEHVETIGKHRIRDDMMVLAFGIWEK